ncbi:MAG: hypothetical protein VYA34_00690 [Myxococcota bacterium]|nr:hypothetical protein [Myxococcota bacterium]
MKNWFSKPLVIALLFGTLVPLVNIDRFPYANAASRFATIDSLIHRGTFIIDESSFMHETVDKAMVDGHFLSTKPPVLSVASAGIYGLVYHITGLSFESNRRGAIRMVTFLVAGISHLLMIWIAHLFLCLWFGSREEKYYRIGLTVYSIGLLHFGYASSLNNHTIASTLLFGAIYLAVRRRSTGRREVKDIVLIALLLMFSATIDLPSLALFALVPLYLWPTLKTKDWLVYVLVGMIPLLLHFWLTYESTGSILPLYLRPEVYDYPGSYWNNPGGIDASKDPIWIYIFHTLVGHHGYFSFTPILLFAVPSLYRHVRGGTKHRDEALLFGVFWLVILAFIWGKTTNYGGVCVGLRWGFMTMPLLLLFALDEMKQRQVSKVATVLWVVIGVLTAVDALDNPWHTSRIHSFISWVSS